MIRCLLAFFAAMPLLAAAMSTTVEPNVPVGQRPLLMAQPGMRNFPSHAQMGVLRIAQIPNAAINGQAIRTAPGFRLFSPDNKLIFAHTVLNQDLQVVFIKEASTDWLLSAWILSPEEIAKLPSKR